MSMVYYDLPIFALGSEEEVNETIKVSIFDPLSHFDIFLLSLSYNFHTVNLKKSSFHSIQVPACNVLLFQLF